MLNFVFAESALELVPKEIWSHPAVVSDSKRRGVRAGEMLLDRSFHHSAMGRLRDTEKRGRPDLVHVALLSVTGTPLYLEGRVRVFVHAYAGLVIELAEKTRIPKSYLRFRGLIEKCLVEGPTEGLLRLHRMSFADLIRKTTSERVFGLTVRGRRATVAEFAGEVVLVQNPCVVVGGFPHGHFSGEVEKMIDQLVRIDRRPLEAHVVAARVVYEVEKATKGFND
ncbi:MAG TPA: ribosome biogenesis protein [Nitrososphaerales archaeon]|nr:ribosome biogenesis protein [Nitrososphaerales archaeon]